MLAEYRERRDYVVNRPRAMPGVQCAEPRGAFYAYPNIAAVLGRDGLKTPMEFAEKLLEKAHVAVVPGEAFGTDAHVRISYAASLETIGKGLDRFQQFIADSLA